MDREQRGEMTGVLTVFLSDPLLSSTGKDNIHQALD
jgi:hypothetical protein